MQFGTSGLRGLADSFTPAVCQAYVAAFVDVTRGPDCGREVFIGVDKRISSPRIASHLADALASEGLQPVYVGITPTPALAAYAFARRCLSIMVTGSHIPAEYNGLKFYRHDGELTKEDEPEIRARLQDQILGACGEARLEFDDRGDEVGKDYIARYTTFFRDDLLSGLKLGVDLHSGAGTELVAQALEALGASVLRFGESPEFLAVDTEAVDAGRLRLYGSILHKHQLDGIVSTDGDGDRPLLIDEKGFQVAGDLIGILTAHFLKIERIATPVTSNSAVEATGWFRSVVRTRVGSPYVIAAMLRDKGRTAGFEANGGFILASNIEDNGRYLGKLPTRDALLPLLATFAEAVRESCSLSELVARLPRRYKLADRLSDISAERALSLLSLLIKSSEVRRSLATQLADPVEIDLVDGVRLICQDGSIVHFRRSGNAPEFRCYVETREREEAGELLAGLMQSLAAYFGKPVLPTRAAESML